ncbi:MAG: hypothetical protein J6U45_06445 [Alistipes sp.]|nr:hypothetical protein [Alistipes sp.]
MSIKARLQEYCKEKHTTIGTFSRHAGISSSYFNNVKSDIGKDIQTRIANTYKDLNIEWLRTGEGEMLKVPATVTVFNPSSNDAQTVGEGIDLSIVPVELVEKLKEEVKAEMETSGEVVPIEQPPLVPDKVVRDPNVTVLDWVNDPDNDHSQNAFNFASILRRTKCILQMDNNAMAPALYQNEFIFLKPFSNDSEIIDGEIYGIETKARGILIRFLYDDGDCYLTRPKNTREFGDIRIPKDKVVNKYYIVFHGSNRLSSLPDSEGEMIKQLGQQDKYISSLIDQAGVAMSEIIKQGARADRLMEQNAELVKKLIDK